MINMFIEEEKIFGKTSKLNDKIKRYEDTLSIFIKNK